MVARPMRLGEIHAGAMITVGRGASIEPPGEIETTTVRPPAHCTVSGTEGDDSLGGTGGKGAVLCGFVVTTPSATRAASRSTLVAGTTRSATCTEPTRIYAGEGRDIIVAGMNRDLAYGGTGDDKIMDL